MGEGPGKSNLELRQASKGPEQVQSEIQVGFEPWKQAQNMNIKQCNHLCFSIVGPFLE